jgi:hypothetical protein
MCQPGPRATWSRLLDPDARRPDATLPDPIVDGYDHDPTEIADKLGVKGMSVYTAFIAVCGETSHPPRQYLTEHTLFV